MRFFGALALSGLSCGCLFVACSMIAFEDFGGVKNALNALSVLLTGAALGILVFEQVLFDRFTMNAAKFVNNPIMATLILEKSKMWHVALGASFLAVLICVFLVKNVKVNKGSDK